MDLLALIQKISGGDVLLIIFALLSLIQITPIKVNPWSALARWFGRAINSDVIKRQEEQQKAIEKLYEIIEAMRKCNARRRADETRNSILKFDDELRRDIPHSKEFWEQTLDNCDWYVDFCDKNKTYVNSKCSSAINNIRTTYDVVKDKNAFI